MINLKHQERVDQIGSESSHHPALKKASKTLEKSTKTFQNAVEVGMSLIGRVQVKHLCFYQQPWRQWRLLTGRLPVDSLQVER